MKLEPIPFPIGAESDPFLAALSSALVPVLGYSENTPFWCAQNGRYCIHCSPCGDRPLERHQESIYHSLLTATGLAFGFDYPWDDTVRPHSLPGYPDYWRWDDGFVDFAMRFAGASWMRMGRAHGRTAILSAVAESIGRGFPALARLEGELDWQLVAGCSGEALFVMKAGGQPVETAAWFDSLRDLIVITGRRDRNVRFEEILRRIEAALAHPEHDAVETAVMDALDRATPENAAEVAAMLNGINGVLIEARWHAAEAMCASHNLLNSLRPEESAEPALSRLFFERYICDNHDETHGLGWKVWALLDVRPENGYRLTDASARRILQPDVRSELKRLFHLIFENDRAVLNGVRAFLRRPDASQEV